MNAPWWITRTLAGVDAELADQQAAPVARVHDDRVDGVVQAPLGASLAGARLAREQVVRGQDVGRRGSR